ncbi:MAG: 2Fe-2S iron-sulfur cluster-binding protein [Pseudomonadales bacterium]|jgi:2Fe-2S ferredoxin|nr:2Fe-2S iron-sulfur cluster-binding protein [Pseudomonadales bacterium]MDP6472412.1 2Fe-2S iron-sulfur cluster-binding protein [Pseudomonadales bacterium]MDP6828208.1 2Fe-2S iron-sulfur cluster-binding protein [Pseudomonadales bacterium]
MPKVTYVEADGTRHEVDVPVDTSLMQGALNYMVPGIEGDCGGLCACGTCHIYVPQQWWEQCGDVEELEQGILAFAFDVEDNSRLSCQIQMSDALDGIEILLPDRQY